MMYAYPGKSTAGRSKLPLGVVMPTVPNYGCGNPFWSARHRLLFAFVLLLLLPCCIHGQEGGENADSPPSISPAPSFEELPFSKKGLYRQDFWVPPDPNSEQPVALFYDEMQQRILGDIFASYTNNLVVQSVEEVRSVCVIDSQAGSVRNATDGTNATINTIDYTCEWVSGVESSVDLLPALFHEYISENLDMLMNDMLAEGLPVIEAYAPSNRTVSTLSPTSSKAPMGATAETPAPSPAPSGEELVFTSRGLYRQDFWVPPDPNSEQPVALFYNETQQRLLAEIFASYTNNLVNESISPVQSVCVIDLQVGSVRNAINGSLATINTIDYNCDWDSRGPVDFLPADFLKFISENLDILMNDMLAEGLPVVEAYEPTIRTVSTPSPTISLAPSAPPTGYPTMSESPSRSPSETPSNAPTPVLQFTGPPAKPIVLPTSERLSAGAISAIVISVGLVFIAGLVLYYLDRKRIHRMRNEEVAASVYASRVGDGQEIAAPPPQPRPRGGWRTPFTPAVPLPSTEDEVSIQNPPIGAQTQPVQPADQQLQSGGRLPLPSFKDQARPVAAPNADAPPANIAPQQADRHDTQVAHRVNANAPDYKDQCRNVPPLAAAEFPAEHDADDADDSN